MIQSLVFAVIVAVAGSAVVGCATREARVDDDYSGAALARDVRDSDKQFPYGPAPFVGRPDSDLR